MNPIVTISGGGIIGNYISSRLNKNNIESLVIEKSPADLREKENIRTLTLNSYSKELLDDLGIDIDYEGERNANNIPSLDRINSSKGYVKGNVRIISNRANHLKLDASSDELIKVIEDLKKLGQ